jgi:hypothetical protein
MKRLVEYRRKYTRVLNAELLNYAMRHKSDQHRQCKRKSEPNARIDVADFNRLHGKTDEMIKFGQ